MMVHASLDRSRDFGEGVYQSRLLTVATTWRGDCLSLLQDSCQQLAIIRRRVLCRKNLGAPDPAPPESTSIIWRLCLYTHCTVYSTVLQARYLSRITQYLPDQVPSYLRMGKNKKITKLVNICMEGAVQRDHNLPAWLRPLLPVTSIWSYLTYNKVHGLSSIQAAVTLANGCLACYMQLQARATGVVIEPYQ